MPRRPALLLAAALAVAGLALAPLAVPHARADEPQQQYGDGYVPTGARVTPSAGLRALEADGVYGAAADPDPPVSVDLTQWAAPAGDQGSLNSCVSWAIGYTLLGWYSRRMNAPTRFAPMYVYSQTHLSNTADGGGSYVRDAFNVVGQQGVDTSADYQPQGDDDFTTMPTTAQRSNAALYTTLGYTRLYANASGNVGAGARTAIEQSLAAGRPVGLALPIYEGFYFLDTADSSFTNADATGSPYGYHYVAVLGYDATGVTIENSWGTWWGDHGFAHLDWAFVTAKTVEAESAYGFSAASLPLPTPTPTPTPTATPTPTSTSAPTPTSSAEPSLTPTPVVAPAQEPSVPSVPTVLDPTPSVPPFVLPAQPAVEPPSTEVTAPSAPVRLAPATAAAGGLSVRWASPMSDGGAPVTDYRVLVSGHGISKVLLVQQPTLALRGMRPYTRYRVTVQALNGSGALSPAASIVVRTAAIAPRILTFASRHGTLRWHVDASGSGAVTGYRLIVRAGGKVVLDRTYRSSTSRLRPTLASGHRSTATLTVRTASGRTATERATLD